MEMYLNEANLGLFLAEAYKDKTIIKNKGIPENTGIRPDYLILEDKLIFEFNGPRHYTESKTVLKDVVRTKELEKHGYKVIEIPYFVQITCSYLYHLDIFDNDRFNEILKEHIFDPYLDGFIKAEVLPADFCIAGYTRFLKELELFPEDIRESILLSLKAKSVLLGIDRVAPTDELVQKIKEVHLEDGYWCYFMYLNNKPYDSKKQEFDEEDYAIIRENYLKLGGKSAEQEFMNKLNVLSTFVAPAYTGGDTPFHRQQAFNCLIAYCRFDFEEASRVFDAVSELHPIT